MTSRPAPAELAAWLARELPGRMSERGVPGLSVSIFEAAGSPHTIVSGVRRAGHRALVAEDSIFEVGSLGKPIVAQWVLELASRGRLGLDTPLASHLGGELEPPTRDPRIELVTARHVLTHTSGLPNWRPSFDPDEPPDTLVFSADPGARWIYSGEGFQYLQSVAERLAGVPLAEGVERSILTPLELRDASFVWSDRFAHRACFGHPGNAEPAPPRRWSAALAAGSLCTTAGDYARYAQTVLRGPAPAPEVEIAKTADGSVGWGLGWGVERTSGTGACFFHHGSRSNGFEALVIGSPDAERGVVILTNAAGGLALAVEIAEHVLPGPHPGLRWLVERSS